MVSYKKFQKKLIDEDVSKSKIKSDLKLSSATMAKLNSNKYVAMSVIEKICQYFDCNIEEVIEFKNIRRN